MSKKGNKTWQAIWDTEQKERENKETIASLRDENEKLSILVGKLRDTNKDLEQMVYKYKQYADNKRLI